MTLQRTKHIRAYVKLQAPSEDWGGLIFIHHWEGSGANHKKHNFEARGGVTPEGVLEGGLTVGELRY